ncbi:hypothetical protein FRB94_011954 [Tulasnella sp. JGI-2019a]|nr:hypothetical protein FRB93_012718 [Tulasnella sp. JGI-2019a]KAG9009537.1 hypothetical protein FRB94_011954 [Tulasnella sp. JGI-2019a]
MIVSTTFVLLLATCQTFANNLVSRQANLNSCLSTAGITTVVASDPSYANASLAYNRRFQYSPAAIVYPSTPEAVQTVVQCASGQSIPVVARSGGHSYAAFGLGGQNGALVIDVSQMKAITVDAPTGIAHVQTGNRLGELAEALWNQGQRALPHGTCPYVGTGGHASFGGYGLFSRTAGLLLDRVVSADIVLANGTSLTASNSSNADLFWAIQGAAPSFGIVTAFSYATLAAPVNTINWQIAYTSQISKVQAVSILSAYQTFAFSNPPNALSVLLFISPDGKGSISMGFSGSFYGTEEDFTTAITPLKNGLPGAPTLTSNSFNWIDGMTAIDGPLATTQPDTHDTFFAKSILINSQMSNDSWTSWVNYMTTTGASSSGTGGLAWWAQIDLYGGAISSIASGATAYSPRDAVLNIQFYGPSGQDTPFPAVGITFMNGLVSSLTADPYAAYSNYADPTLTADQWHKLYFGSNYRRLTVIKRDVDSNNLFSFPQSIEVAADGVTATASGSQSTGTAPSKSSALASARLWPSSLLWASGTAALIYGGSTLIFYNFLKLHI